MGSPIEIDFFYNSKAGQPLPCPEIKKQKKQKKQYTTDQATAVPTSMRWRGALSSWYDKWAGFPAPL